MNTQTESRQTKYTNYSKNTLLYVRICLYEWNSIVGGVFCCCCRYINQVIGPRSKTVLNSVESVARCHRFSIIQMFVVLVFWWQLVPDGVKGGNPSSLRMC